ncbi:MAG: hypothetical protein V4489_07370 [Chlamydiota bacterium]
MRALRMMKSTHIFLNFPANRLHSLVCLANHCFPEKNYEKTYKKINAETPNASCQEHLITGVVLGMIAPTPYMCAVSLLTHDPVSTYVVASGLIGCACISTCILSSYLPKDKKDSHTGFISTGIRRDYVVLSKTFTP